MLSRAIQRLCGRAAGIALPVAGAIALATPQAARASDWGCEVVLCLATPGSPTTYAACVPPITRLWRHLALGGAFPTCIGVGVRTRQTKHGYALTVTQSDGATSRYQLDTRYRTVTPQ